MDMQMPGEPQGPSASDIALTAKWLRSAADLVGVADADGDGGDVRISGREMECTFHDVARVLESLLDAPVIAYLTGMRVSRLDERWPGREQQPFATAAPVGT